MKENKKKNSRNITFKKLFLIFVIGSVVGNYYEMILNLVRHYLRDGSIFWEVRRGFIYGPFSPVYGLGAVLMTLVFAEKDYKWYKVILYGALICGTFEYLISFLQEKIIGTISWNYTRYPLDINGRTTIPIMLLWGIMTLIFTKYLYPFITKIINNTPYMVKEIVIYPLIIFITFDAFISGAAVFRQSMRRDGKPPVTILGKICDKVYTDERLKEVYPNMRVPER